MKPSSFSWTVITCCGLVLATAHMASAQMRADGDATHVKASPLANPFLRDQLSHYRVRDARDAAEPVVERLFRERNIPFPAAEVYLRVFKWERTLELWVRSSTEESFQLLKSYRICALAGVAGPKRNVGDRQVPEGFYYIDDFNPASSFHLSMRINYPNRHDRVASAKGVNLGGDIFIHGGCVSEGCLAMTDETIQELYWIALTTRAAGQERIPVHIFPARFDKKSHVAKMTRRQQPDSSVVVFWHTLKPGFEFFKNTRRVPEIVLDTQGHYQLRQAVEPSISQ